MEIKTGRILEGTRESFTSFPSNGTKGRTVVLVQDTSTADGSGILPSAFDLSERVGSGSRGQAPSWRTPYLSEAAGKLLRSLHFANPFAPAAFGSLYHHGEADPFGHLREGKEMQQALLGTAPQSTWTHDQLAHPLPGLDRPPENTVGEVSFSGPL